MMRMICHPMCLFSFMVFATACDHQDMFSLRFYLGVLWIVLGALLCRQAGDSLLAKPQPRDCSVLQWEGGTTT